MYMLIYYVYLLCFMYTCFVLTLSMAFMFYVSENMGVLFYTYERCACDVTRGLDCWTCVLHVPVKDVSGEAVFVIVLLPSLHLVAYPLIDFIYILFFVCTFVDLCICKCVRVCVCVGVHVVYVGVYLSVHWLCFLLTWVCCFVCTLSMIVSTLEVWIVEHVFYMSLLEMSAMRQLLS